MRQQAFTVLPVLARQGLIRSRRFFFPAGGEIIDDDGLETADYSIALLETLHYLPRMPAMKPVDKNLHVLPGHMRRGIGYSNGISPELSNAEGVGLDQKRNLWEELQLIDPDLDAAWPKEVRPFDFLQGMVVAGVLLEKGIDDHASEVEVRRAMRQLMLEGMVEEASAPNRSGGTAQD